MNKNYLLSAILTCLLFSVSNAQVDLNRGLAAYYPFNGNANDATGHGLNGFARNGAQLTTDKAGNPNSAYLLDGLDDYIEILDDPRLRFRDSFSVCISFMKIAQEGGTLIEKRSVATGAVASFDLAAGSAGANGAIKTDGNCTDALAFDYTSFAPAPALNQWYCIVLTYNSGIMKFYQDGVLISSTSTFGSRMDSCSGSNIRIGYHLDFDPIPMNGKVDEVRFYDRAISQEEVSSLCGVTSSLNCNNWLKMPDKLTGVSIGELDITGNQVTVEAMCNASDIYDLSRALVSKHGWNANCNYFLCPDLAQITTDQGFFSATSPCSFVSNKTYHVAMVYDGSTLRLYRNGFLMQEVQAYGNLVTNDWPTTIGEYAYAMYYNNAGISNIFKGYINEVRIWNVARTQQQIRDYMNTSLPDPATQTGLLAYYTFDNLTNKQGNSTFDGVLRGAATINNSNPNCNFTADSCETAAPDCTHWLKVPQKLSGVSIGELDITGNQVTVEAMCRATDIYDLSRSLVSKHGWDANCNYFLCPDLAQITTDQGFYSAASPCTFVSDKTYHVAMVYNGSSLRLYRNGFLMQEVPAVGNLVNNNWPATIGEYAYAMYFNNASISNVFKGYINEVRIWNVARTQQQIKDYMNTSLPDPATQPGLLAYYTFDSLNNKQGNAAYDGTLRGTATINDTIPDCNFVADSCDATAADCSHWLSTPSNPSYVSTGQVNVTGNQLTVEATFNRTTPYVPGGGNNSEGDLVSKHNTFTDVNYLLRPNHAFITTTNGFFATPDVCAVELNKTYHVAMVYDGSTLKFYRDGLLISQVAASGNLIQNAWNTRIGFYEPQGFNTNFIGYINEVRIWNTARSQSQIQANMTSSLPSPTTQPGLLAYYTFDNLLNKQGNTAFNGVLGGSASINATNPQCDLVLDSCANADTTSCISWLSTPSNPSYVSAGQVNVTGNHLSVEAMFNRTSAYVPGGGDNSEGDLVSKHNTFTDVNYLLRPNHAFITTTNGFFATPDICSAELNKTYHVAMVYDGSTLKFFRDGILMSQVAASGDLIQNSWNTRIGIYEPQAYNTNFIGYINEVRIWNTARTQSQILANMTNRLANPSTQTGLLAYYTFDNLLNKQGNAAYNAALGGSATINVTNPQCSLTLDSCFSVVPVKLVSFISSISNNKNVLLTWRTAEEYNIAKYTVQRSLFPNKGFEAIGTVNAKSAGAGNSYSFTDNNVQLNTRYYYRLQIMENTGSFKYSDTRNEKIASSSLYAGIYPNPTSGNVTLSVKNYQGIAVLNLYNNLGQSLLSKTVHINTNADIMLQLSSQPKGSYWLQINMGRERIVKKIIRQ